MTRVLATLALAFAFAAVASAQQGLPVPKSTGSDHAIDISGCVHGTRLIPRSSSAINIAGTLGATEFVLDGPKDLLRTLRKEHDRHEEEVSGIAHLPPAPAAAGVGVASAPAGSKGRITVGTRLESGGIRSGPLPIRLTIKSVRHLSESCATPRS